MTEPQPDSRKQSRHRLFGMAGDAALLGSLGLVSVARAARASRPAPESPAPQEG